ncbi:MAG TPA: acetylxylan esterase [Bryobacteraceae bacterium]|nr:acetylxylan esterase [Bryobacteraceae bacterium]
MSSNPYLMRRREMLASLAGLGLLPRSLRADVVEPGPAMLPNYLAGRLNPIAEKWKAEIAGLRTADRARERNNFVRAKEHELLGGFPEKTPLGARKIKTTERDGYRIENVMYQSRPDFWVTANLYVPTRGSGPYPAVISPCGHYDPGRFYPAYQLAYRNMVENGFIVLAFDPIGQGERRHFWNPTTNQVEQLGNMGRGSSATTEHSLACHILELIGENINEHFVWDGMRGIDYLLSRPEVDPKRIACAGHSGGGTATMYLSCADERIQCVVIHEGGLGHQWPIDPQRPRMEPADGEQNLFGAASYGMDFVELSAAIAPRPLLISVEHFNPAFNAAAEDVKKRYALLGVADRFTTVEANAPHAWTKKLSIATSDWLSRTFYNHPGPAESPDYQPEPEEVLRCMPNGSLRYSGFDTVFTRNRKVVESLHPTSPRDMPAALRRLLKYRKADATVAARETGPGRAEIQAEEGITLPVIIARPTGSSSATVVYLDDSGAEAANASGLLGKIAQTGRTVVAVDVRGMGPSKLVSTTRRSGAFVQIFDAETWASYSAWQLEDSLLGMRVADTLRAVDYALSLKGGSSGVQLVGRGMGALLAMLATALDSRVTGAVCHGGLVSYATMASADGTLVGADLIIRGVLKNFDLPDVAASIASRPLRIIDPIDAMRKPVDLESARSTYRRTAGAYSRKGAAGKFEILAANSSNDLVDVYFK